MTTAIRAWLVAMLVLALAMLTAPARAHEMSMAEMDVREISPGEFLWQWSAANDKRPMGDDLKPQWPKSCEAGPNVLRCGADGLKGTLAARRCARKRLLPGVCRRWCRFCSAWYTSSVSRAR